MKNTLLCLLISVVTLKANPSDSLFEQKGSDPTFEEVVKSGKLPKAKTSKTGVTGSTIAVQNQKVELTPDSKGY